MGIIQRQGLKGTAISYIGAILGALTVMFVYPYCMNTADIGLFRLILDAAGFFGLLALFGTGYSISYFYPYYNSNEKTYNQFFNFNLLISFFGFVVLTLILITSKNLVSIVYSKNSNEFLTYFLYIIPIIFFNNILTIIESQAQNLHRIVVPKIAREIILRVAVIILIILFYFKILNFSEVVIGYIISLFIVTLITIFYIVKISPYRLSFTLNFNLIDRKKEIIIYAFFIILAITGGIFSTRLDSFFLSSTDNGLNKNGIYTTVVFLILMMDMPIRSLLSISTPIVNESIKQNDIQKVEQLYKKTSVLLVFASLLIFALLWCNIDSIFNIMPNGKDFKIAKWVVLILGFSKIIDAATSINSIILSYSKYYRFSLVLSFMLGFLTILTAYILIPRFNFEGAAFSTAISMAIFQSLMCLIVFKIFKIHPFTKDTIKLVFVFVLLMLIVYLLPNFNPFISIAYKSLIILLATYLIIFKLKISEVIYLELSKIIEEKLNIKLT